MAQRIAAKVDGVVEAAGKDMTEEERVIFYRCLSGICENLEELADN